MGYHKFWGWWIYFYYLSNIVKIASLIQCYRNIGNRFLRFWELLFFCWEFRPGSVKLEPTRFCCCQHSEAAKAHLSQKGERCNHCWLSTAAHSFSCDALIVLYTVVHNKKEKFKPASLRLIPLESLTVYNSDVKWLFTTTSQSIGPLWLINED